MTFPLLRDAVRLVRRNPVLSLVAILSLAIGITINATAFSVIDSLVLRPLPIADPAGLVRLYSTTTSGGRQDLSYPDFLDVRQSAKTLSTMAAFRTSGASVGNVGETPEIVTLGVVSANYFSVLGVNARMGRVFGDADREASGGAPAAIISDRYWKRKFAADPNVLGRSIRFNTRAWTIVGVLPERFGGTQPLIAPAVWVPIEAMSATSGAPQSRSEHEFAVFGRRAPGVKIEQVNAEIHAIGEALAVQYADTNRDRSLAADFATTARTRNLSVVIALAIGLVSLPLLIACANVMGLLLGRAEERRREMAIRIALGGSRARLVGQLLAETSLLSALAVAVSLVLAVWLLHLIPSVLPPLPIELNLDFRIDARIALATCAVALAATLLAGLAPALMASKTDLTPIIKGHAAGGTVGRHRITMRNALVTGQIAVMFLLLELAALFTASFLNANSMDTGFAPGAMAFATLAPGAAGYNRARAEEFYRQLSERVGRQPDVQAVAFAHHVPLNALYGGGATENVAIAGHEPPKGHTAFTLRYNIVSPRYFDTMGIHLLRGRDFDERDRRDGELTVIINDTMARTFWPGEDPVGRHIDLLPSPGAARTERHTSVIVGVVSDSKYLSLREVTPPYLFFPMAQRSVGEMTLVARGRGSETALAAELRQAIVAIDPELPAIDILTRSDHMRRAFFIERTLAGTVTGLGAISLILAMVGVYGVVAFAVSRRTREIGIEMALGASAAQVMRSVLGHGARLTAAGVVIGAALGIVMAVLFTGSLYGVSAADPRMFLAAAALTFPIALAASYLPARRAARINPIAALRE